MKYHRHLIRCLLDAIAESYKKPADRTIESHFRRHKKWGARDRRLFAGHLYDIVRWRRRLEACSDGLPFEELAERLWVAYLIITDKPLPSWLSIEPAHIQTVTEADKKNQLVPAIYHSFPDWLYRRGLQEVGEKWSELVVILNQEAPVFLRRNSLKQGSMQKLIKDLGREAVYVEPLSDSALRLRERKNVFVTSSFRRGEFEVQDIHSQYVAKLLAPRSGECVIDACAGAGGKTLHIAALMQNKGKILALDIHQWKLDELKKRARRAGVDIVETRLITSNKVIKRLDQRADRLLLDVPCTGSGVFRRNPDAKWRLKPERLQELLELQQKLLVSYSSMLKPGGVMVYSTCSIFPCENQTQVEMFLLKNPEFDLLEQQTLEPISGGGDGFFMALLRRKPSGNAG